MGDFEYVYIPLTTDELRQEAIARHVKTDMDYPDKDICIWHVGTGEGWYRDNLDSPIGTRLTLPSFKAIDELPILRSLGMTFQEIQDYYDSE